jgi:hypothetical protein
MSPRVLFSVALGVGAAGLILERFLGSGFLLFVSALFGGMLFNRVVVTPVWNFVFRFESNPAMTLESAAGGDAVVVTPFDANGHGLVSIEVDGHVVQLLGTLRASDREFRGRVSTGTKLRVENVDAERHRCTVSLI